MDFNYAEHSGSSGSNGAFLYTLASNEFYETLEKARHSGDYLPSLRKLVPEKWILRRGGLWHHAMPRDSNLPPNGFKLHISATLDNARDILKAVIPICVENKTVFKVLQASSLLAITNSKFFPRPSAHKFITVYPQTQKQFLDMASRLHAVTEKFSGPYILSDLPVDDSKVVFYRYGGFLRNSRVTVHGTKKLYIKNPKGDWVADKRVPYFLLPDGISDPIGKAAPSASSDQIVLNSRYRVKKALTFSNCGGTYLATDLRTGDEVVIKEARPHTTVSHIPRWRFYAEDTIVREQKILERLAALSCVPNAIEVFQADGHTFAVQQFFDARPFAQYRAQDNILLAPFEGDRKKARRFCEAFQIIGTNLIKTVLAIHRRKVIIGDISPFNTLVDEQKNIYLIDLESAWDRRWSQGADELSSVWMTPGFRPRKAKKGKKRKQQGVTYKDDWYAVSMVLFSMLLPVNRLNTLSAGIYERFMAAMVEAALLPGWVPATIQLLVQGKPVAALKLLETSDASSSPAGHHLTTRKMTHPGKPRPELEHEVAQTLSDITQYLLKSCDLKRTDRLWPSDYKIFTSNPMSIAYGACGPTLYLHTTQTDIPGKIDQWLCRQPLSLNDYPPGLYLGLAGIAYTFWKTGHQQRAHDILKKALESDLLYEDWGMFYGAAGCGLVCIQMYLWTKDEWFINKAIEIGERMVCDSVSNGHGIGWQDSSGKMLKPGYAFGGSGIALFLLYLHQQTRQTQFLKAARNALEYDIAAASTDYPDRLPRWALTDKSGIWSPYWLEGGCGIGSVIIRFYVMLQEGRYLKLAHDVARANYSRFTILPSQFEGLSGIGDFMLDMYQVTGDSGFADKARSIARSILLYRLQKENGIAMPGRYLSRISNDYGYGSAGVGVFLDRFLHGKPRLLHDLDGMHSIGKPKLMVDQHQS